MVIEALAPFYAWTKALHLISVFAWMAGLFYLPRLYIYHTQQAPGSAQVALFKTMERRLLRAIMNPAMIAAWALVRDSNTPRSTRTTSNLSRLAMA